MLFSSMKFFWTLRRKDAKMRGVIGSLGAKGVKSDTGVETMSLE